MTKHVCLDRENGTKNKRSDIVTQLRSFSLQYDIRIINRIGRILALDTLINRCHSRDDRSAFCAFGHRFNVDWVVRAFAVNMFIFGNNVVFFQTTRFGHLSANKLAYHIFNLLISNVGISVPRLQTPLQTVHIHILWCDYAVDLVEQTVLRCWHRVEAHLRILVSFRCCLYLFNFSFIKIEIFYQKIFTFYSFIGRKKII